MNATGPGPRVVRNATLARLQRRHAVAISVGAFGGVAAAIGLALAGVPVATSELAVFAVGTALTVVGVVVGYHRLFSHRSFKAATPVRVVLAALGAMSGQGNLVFWVALHRMHHQMSDRPGDPHSPWFKGQTPLSGLRGFFHSYLGWTVDHELPDPLHYAHDIMKDRPVAKVNQLYAPLLALGLALPTALGLAFSGPAGALTGFVWGGLVRIFVTQHLVWSITSVAHIFGTRPLDSGDRSTNNALLAIPTLGDSWHNNHHAFPSAAVLSFRWYQLDPAGWIITALERVGLAWDVRRPTAEMIAAKVRR